MSSKVHYWIPGALRNLCGCWHHGKSIPVMSTTDWTLVTCLNCKRGGRPRFACVMP